MMKKIIYTVLFAAAMCSCRDNLTPEIFRPAGLEQLGYEHDGKVTFGFNPDFGANGCATRSMTDGSDIRNIYVAVFDSSGFKLSEYIKADPFTTGPANDTDYQYTIELKVSQNRRILHFIANAPERLRFGSENEVIGELCTQYGSENNDAYWQRMEFDKITAHPVEGEEGYDTKLAEYNAVRTALNSVKLIRNYSKVTVKETCDNFTFDGFWFVNFPDRGSIAPYNRNTGRFSADYASYDNIDDLEDPEKGNYQGFMLATTKFMTDLGASYFHEAEDGVGTGYVYEREKALSSPLYLIVKGTYTDEKSVAHESYYKVAMQDADGSFYAMLRNFNYLVQIMDVRTAGYSSAQAALDGVPSGDISVNVDYQDLPNISDGDARITVSETSLMIIGAEGNTTTARFWYKYEPDISGEHPYTGIHNDTTSTIETPFVNISFAGTSGSTGDVIRTLGVDSDDIGGCRYVTVNTTAVGSLPKTQAVTITGMRWDGSRYQTITRTVHLTLRKAMDIEVSASPNTDSEGNAHVRALKDQPVVINVGIEAGLPSSMFPLPLKIESTVRSITPDNSKSDVQDLPVRYGTGSDGRPAYWFEKTISVREYEAAAVNNGLKTFPVYFVTTVADNETEVHVSHPSFAASSVNVYNYTPATFDNLAFSGATHVVAQPETFSFTMSEVPSTGKVTVTLIGLEPAPSSPLVYKQPNPDGGGIYELAVSNTTASFGVIPYIPGKNATVALSSYLFNDASASVRIEGQSGAPIVYVNADGSGDGTRLATVTSPKVFGDNLIPGQTATLTFYVLEDELPTGATVSIGQNGSTAASRITGASVTVDGSTYLGYQVTGYTVPSQGDNSAGFTANFPVYVKIGSAAAQMKGSFSVPVCGIRQDAEATSSPFDANRYYLIKSSNNRYIYNPGTNNATSILKSTAGDPIQVKYLMKINGGVVSTASTSTTYYLDFNYSRSGSWLSYSYNYTPRLDNANNSSVPTDFVYNYQSGSGFTFAQTFDEKTRSSGSANNVTRYMYDNNGSIAQNTNAAYWHIYPVTFVAPTAE